jgi:oligogalacturonide transport system ATP-binding protein
VAAVSLRNIEKVYPNGFQAVRGVNLEIQDGEFMVLVGPSGSAKSTLLRMVAGLERITHGDLSIGGRRVNDLPPKQRGIAMVFQNYALYPHMSVYGNLAFGLKLSGLPKVEVDQRVRHAAELLEMSHLLERHPRQLSGGQAQRVAVGRAIVKKPEVFLFDEPLSNLDAKLRASMRVRLTELHHTLREQGQSATVIYVTHDQVEAMTMGERICVLKDGLIQQIDTPRVLYERPANAFVASFIGSPEMNLVPATLERQGDALGLRLASLWLPLPPELATAATGADADDGAIQLGLRPEHIAAMPRADGGDVPISAQLQLLEHMGNEVFVRADMHGTPLTARVAAEQLGALGALRRGDPCTLHLNLRAAHLFTRIDGRRLC